MVKMLGPAIAIILCVTAFALALRSAAAYGSANALSIAAAAVAVTAMSQCLILAARFRMLEPVFGGLDRMYRAHKYLGITALGMMIVHNLVEPDFEDWVQESWSGDLAGDIGEVAFPALLTLILLSWIKRIPRIRWEIPYQFWRFSHRLTGVFFMMVAVHQLMVDRPFGWTDPLSMYLNGACVIGISCYIFTEFIDKPWRRRNYEVAFLDRQAGAIEIALRPLDRPMHWKPGQFAFLTVPGSGSRLGEPHPFTMINPPRPDGGVRFAVKVLGDWTRHLPVTLKPGATVQIEGPYGRFDFRKFNFRKESQRQVWIAGGIGITPFLA